MSLSATGPCSAPSFVVLEQQFVRLRINSFRGTLRAKSMRGPARTGAYDCARRPRRRLESLSLFARTYVGRRRAVRNAIIVIIDWIGVVVVATAAVAVAVAGRRHLFAYDVAARTSSTNVVRRRRHFVPREPIKTAAARGY